VQVPIHLEGGPCNGRNAVVTRSGDLLPGYTCRGVDYQPTDRVTSAKRVIYTTKASQSGGGGGAGAPVAVPSKAHKAWNTMLRTIFVDSPKELKQAYNARAAIRRLRHRRGLK
jgi:hypothetical protein